MPNIPKPHEIYRHFKGNLYQITAVAEHSETGEQLVVYQALYGDYRIYARPLTMFMERLEPQKAAEAGQEFRFLLQGAKEQQSASGGGEKDFRGEVPGGALEEQKEEDVWPASEGTKGTGETEETPDIDPMVMEFLEADTYAERLNILVGLHHRITDEMITTMAVASDVEVPEGDLEERFAGLKNCLVMLDKYECSRIR